LSRAAVASPFGDIVTSSRRLAETHPKRELFRFLQDGEERAVALTCAELDHRARRIAADLQARQIADERVMIALPPGVDYVAALLGCFFAGAVAVPSFPAARSQELRRIIDIARDCTPKMAIVEDRSRTTLPEISGMEWCGIGSLMRDGSDSFVPQPRRGDDLASSNTHQARPRVPKEFVSRTTIFPGTAGRFRRCKHIGHTSPRCGFRHITIWD
jgi:acyl-CoA synthetase (AMP-forming)/AMP-acid ligase II